MKVFDASAVLALLQQEPGAEAVAAAMLDDELLVGAVNHAEVCGKLFERGATEAEILAAWRELPLQVVSFDAATSLRSARLRPATRQLGLSLGDRCCLALAQERGATVITADRAWAGLAGFDIVLVR